MVNLSPVKRDIKMEVDSDQTADIHQRNTCFQLIQKFTKEVQCTHDMEQDVVFKKFIRAFKRGYYLFSLGSYF